MKPHQVHLSGKVTLALQQPLSGKPVKKNDSSEAPWRSQLL